MSGNNAVAEFRPAPRPVPFEQQVELAQAFASSGLFGIKTKEQALALMALCEAEGMHPAIAIRDYHIIQGKPALKADAMLARFQASGGKVRWVEMTDERVSGEFSHPSGGSVVMEWDKQRAQTAGFWGKDNWRKFPRAMLRARVISEGIRTVFPGVVVGTYTPEEVQDFDTKATVVATVEPQTPAEAPAQNGNGSDPENDFTLDERLEAVKVFSEQIKTIKDALADMELKAAAGAWYSLTEREQRMLWFAPSKGGPFTTDERKLMKTPEFRMAYYTGAE